MIWKNVGGLFIQIFNFKKHGMLRRVNVARIRRCLLCLVFFFGLFLIPGNVDAAPLIIPTKHTILSFNSEEDMIAFSDSIHFDANISLAAIFNSPSAGDVKNDLIRKVDLLFEKVQLILDMRKAMNKVTVRVVSNGEQLNEIWGKIYKNGNNPRGWFIFEHNTVYLNARDVHEGMLAHELAHAIIDHYLTVRPPRATAEILAKYVDMNLFEEIKNH